MPNQTPSFIKVLVGCFSNKLRIPESFVDEFGEDLHGKLVLTSNAGNPAVVSVERGSRGCFFETGWPSFFKEHDLQEGDYLVFNFTGRRTVDVVIYHSTGCVKRNAEVQTSNPCPSSERNETERSPTKPRKGMGKEGRKEVQTARPYRSSERNLETEQLPNTREGMAKGSKLKPRKAPMETESEEGYSSDNAPQGLPDCFELIFKKYMEYYVYIPLGFCEITRLGEKKTAQLQDPSGNVWPVSVISGGKRSSKRFAGGWPAFVAANGVAIGDTIEFNYKPESAMVKVKILRPKSNSGNDSEVGNRTDAVNPERSKPYPRNGRNRETKKFPKPRKGLKRKRGAPMKAESRKRHFSGKNASPGLAASFQLVYKKYMESSNAVTMPVAFSNTAKLSLKKNAQLQDPSGQVWTVSVISAGKGLRKRFAGGWPAFAAASGVVVGDRIEFCYKPESGLVQVKIIEQRCNAGIDSEVEKQPWERSDAAGHLEEIIVID